MKSSVRERVVDVLKRFAGSSIPQSYLYRAVDASKSRVSEVLRELEKEGLITRVTVGRSNIVYVREDITEHRSVLDKKHLRLAMVYSSEYLFLGYFAKRLSGFGIKLEVVVTRDGLAATKAVAEGTVDLALSPLVGQLYLHPAYKTYRILLGGLYGGYRVMYKPGRRVVYSSLISTMDYVRHSSLEKGLIDATATRYFTDPLEARERARRGGYVVVWHPVYKQLEAEGFRQVLIPDDLNVDFCCTLAVSNVVDTRTYELVKRAYFDSLDDYRKDPEKHLEYYSAVTGIDISVLKDAVREYWVSENISRKTAERVVSSFAPTVPSRIAYVNALDER